MKKKKNLCTGNMLKEKRNIVFCLILTELFLLKYIHKHMIDLLFLFGVFCIYLIIFPPHSQDVDARWTGDSKLLDAAATAQAATENSC